jgi:hypothetical protein
MDSSNGAISELLRIQGNYQEKQEQQQQQNPTAIIIIIVTTIKFDLTSFFPVRLHPVLS